MPFTLVYGVEVMLPIEIELPTLCLVAATQLDPIINDYATVCIMALEHLEKCQSDTSKLLQCYREMMSKKDGSLLQ